MHISKTDTQARHGSGPLSLRDGDSYPVAACGPLFTGLIPLPVQPQDQSRVDEKYSLRGYGSLDARFGCDWGGNTNGLCCGGRQD
jgi:hypothetical protein